MAIASKVHALPAGVAGLSFDDEFTGDSLNLSNWNYRELGVRNSATNTQNAVAVANGDLTITTYTSGGINYTGMIGTQSLFQQPYGYFETRAMFSDSPGGWSAFWVQSPTEGNPVDNPQAAGVEMDIVEHRSVNSGNSNISNQVDSALHWDGYGTAEQDASLVTTVPTLTTGSWHTYGLLWTPTGYTFYYDGTAAWSQSGPVSAAAQYMILSSEVEDANWAGNVPAGGYGALNTSTTKLTVDYVHAYALANVYSPTAATTDSWSAGSNWNFAPVSNFSSELTFVDTTGTTVLASGLTNTNTNTSTTLFESNVLDLGGMGPASGAAATISMNGSGPGLSLVTDSLSGLTPVINLSGMAGTAGLNYKINSPISLTNNTTFQGAGTASFSFNGKISGSGQLTKTSAGLITLSASSTYTGGTNISTGAILVTNSSALGTGPVSITVTGSSTASLQLSGGITITNTFNGFGSETAGDTPTIENISGNNTVTAPLSITSTGGNGAIFQSDAGTLNLSGGLTTTLTSTRGFYLQGTGNGIVAGNITENSTSILQVQKSGSGTWTLSGSCNTYGLQTSVNGGTLIFASPGAMPIFSKLLINSGTVVAGSHSGSVKNTLFASSLGISGSTNSWNGLLDLTNNDLVVRNGSIGTLSNQTREGFNLGNWQGGTGIVSSTAAADTNHLTALAVIQNSTTGSTSGGALYTSFDGQTVMNSDVLVKYTYYGDANLDGKVDASDYSLIDSGYATHATGWYNGDFNYDGVINGSDYTLIDNAFNTQGTAISDVIATPTSEVAGDSAVPEPASLSVLSFALLSMLGRRRRGSHPLLVIGHTTGGAKLGF